MITNLEFEPHRLGNYLHFVPYNVSMPELYNAKTLYDGFVYGEPETFDTCRDQRIYKYYLETGKQAKTPLELLARTLHDHFIRTHINELCRCYDRRVVGVMGGSAMKRNEAPYEKIVHISKQLTENDILVTSGGGPGAMEAAMLGGMMAGRGDIEVNDALSILSKTPLYGTEGFMESAFDVYYRYPQREGYECLSIPTWLYGHEPTAPFATHIGKLFENSVREDLLLTISMGGIVFAPGSAGTMQEIFQEAVQDHYLTLGVSSPMIFLGKEFWTKTMPAYTMLHDLMKTGRYKNLKLFITDDPDEVVSIFLNNIPKD